ncbi:uncharacterized protein LOC119687288 [Teleopsis dalmanni]|uniref:uncharacterized protein LOC119687288 n=1 Tax=Teleopsis dalmanni TaxID=139649 RepID=UPI000D32A502|nr:uncharacterized protein LOC119687288 [Teleopsis dalmanni]XP_037957478.1 uncharacterized protein LOC119687288 [Teleopsis dalmanni]XP_037957479.1 uncharacterized protein LOC119687288 [Teleopsis dalmanni]XP_037957480.1 uncharacterized protein LOC119687288 [Teleopsis dalmanni]XP_037957481.1 uncharacterized protein LOC119687288 [Teleopsis dalmanni]
MKRLFQVTKNLDNQQKKTTTHAAKITEVVSDITKDTNRKDLTARVIPQTQNQVNKSEKGKSVAKMTTGRRECPPVPNNAMPTSDEERGAVSNFAATAQKRYGYKPYQERLNGIEKNRFQTSRQKKELQELKHPDMFLSKPKTSN